MSQSTPFRFKRFSIHHDRCAMKVGTDGVLLGALAGDENPENILEIGVGTGVVSLMLAQRFPEAKITGVEIEKEAWIQATENAKQSPWGDRIEFINMPFQEFWINQNKKYDLIVSNPPYFTNHLKSPDPKRNMALHNDGLTFGELAAGVVSLIDTKSEFWVILPPSQMLELEKQFSPYGLKITSKIQVKDNPSKNIIRVIFKFSLFDQTLNVRSLSIKSESGIYSNDYSELLREFLIVF